MTQNAHDSGGVPGYAVVPSEDYPTIQEAHDALPPEGGGIWLRDSVTETGIVLEKPVKLVGQGTEFDTADALRGRPVDAEPLGGPGATIDTSGGDGIHVAATGAVLRDVQIVGDYTGGYGLEVDGNASRGCMTFENVLVAKKGGHGVVVTGGQLNSTFDVTVWDCRGDGWRFRCDWFNEHLFERMVAYGCAGNGVTIEQSMDPDAGDQRSRFGGNAVQQFWMEVNDGWGLYVEDEVRFEGNHLTGYGIEHNQDRDDGSNKVMRVRNLGTADPERTGPSGNALHVRNLLEGTVEVDREEFETFVATNYRTEDGRVELLETGE